MKIVTYNIRYGLGLDCQVNLERIAATICHADVIALQEVDRYWNHSGNQDQPAVLSSYLPKHYSAYFPAFDVHACATDASGNIQNRRRQFGPMILSKWPISYVHRILLPKLGTINELSMDTGAIEVVVETPSGPLRFYSLHLSALSSRERMLQIEFLNQFHRSLQVRGSAWTGSRTDNPGTVTGPVFDNWTNDEKVWEVPSESVLLGDFNFVPGSAEYNALVGTHDPCYGRIAHVDGFVDGWDVSMNQPENRETWFPDPPEREPGHPLCLDYCLVTPRLAQKVRKVWIDLEASGSDHKPYWIEIDL